ncbi:hypothetical protein E2562_017880 [Oryza meyeriana var. granulata]|uniref:Uncharacterized protein n=1 Tax=Oryza meyeriana var. granulata TaxID=110450 RepID=A0A6G1CPT1_9ORYZ|nr:hypothetical protein E2562_017880 [Oryza meyeriana var. granulata]
MYWQAGTGHGGSHCSSLPARRQGQGAPVIPWEADGGDGLGQGDEKRRLDVQARSMMANMARPSNGLEDTRVQHASK